MSQKQGVLSNQIFTPRDVDDHLTFRRTICIFFFKFWLNLKKILIYGGKKNRIFGSCEKIAWLAPN